MIIKSASTTRVSIGAAILSDAQKILFLHSNVLYPYTIQRNELRSNKLNKFLKALNRKPEWAKTRINIWPYRIPELCLSLFTLRDVFIVKCLFKNATFLYSVCLYS